MNISTCHKVTLRPAGRATRDFEGRRQCLNNARWIISSILCPMESRQHSLERARNLQIFVCINYCHRIDGLAVVGTFVL